MDRREFLSSGMVLPLGVSALSSHVYGSDSINIRGNRDEIGPRIKISLNAFSFNSELRRHMDGGSGGMSLFDVLDYCARIGFDAVDPTGYYFPGYPDRPDRAFLNRFKRQAHRLGLAISGTGIRNDFANKDAAVRKEGLALTREWVEVAADMGAPVLRVFAGHQPDGEDWDTAAARAIECLRTCAEYGKQAGVIVAIQNHAHLIKTADQAIAILRAVDSEWIGLVADTGSFLTENPYDDIDKVIPWAVNWQLKDLLQSRQGGPIDVPRFTRLLLKHNYRGYVPIEALPGPDGREKFNPHQQVEKLFRSFRSALDELA